MALGLSIIIGGFILVSIGVIALYIVSIFNGLIQLKNNIKKSFANIDVLLKQRAEEIPNLMETVKGYMKYEEKVLKDVTKARTSFLSAKTVEDKAAADNMMTAALKTVFAVAENYPKLQANENFMQLQNRISGLENEVADRREFYNDSVNTYNIRIETFPDRIFAGWMGFTKPEPLFEATENERKNVKVKF
ncbi:MAG: LemA family protein [archaeon]